jgi:hypothetical protein
MKLKRHKFKYQGYYNSNQGYPAPCECVLEYVEPIEAEALEKRVVELETLLAENTERLEYWKNLALCLKCCGNCAHYFDSEESNCVGCTDTGGLDKWEKYT